MKAINDFIRGGVIFLVIMAIIALGIGTANADGTGVFINNNGDIMTNDHVVEMQLTNPNVRFFVLIDGVTYFAKVVVHGGTTDLAIIHIDYKSPCLKVVSDTIENDASIYPLMFNVLDGKYYDFDNKKEIFPSTVLRHELVLTHADIIRLQNSLLYYPSTSRPGNSGSPILNEDLNIVSVVFAGAGNLSAGLSNEIVSGFADTHSDIIQCPVPNKKNLGKNLVWIYQLGG